MSLLKRVKPVLAWGLGLGLLGWLLSRLPLSVLPDVLGRISPTVWLGATLAIALSYAFRAARMQLVLVAPSQRRGHLWARWPVWRVMLLHNAAINLLPLRGGELAFPWLARQELGLPLSRSVAALMWMRIQDLGVLLLLAAVAWPGWPLAARAGGVALWLLGVLLLPPVAGGVLRALVPEPVAGGPRWRQAAYALRCALEEPAHHHPLTWLCTLGNWAVKIAAGSALLAAACHVSWTTGWAGAVGGELTAVLPIQGPASLGTYEAGVHAGMAWIAGLGAATPREAVLGALTWHLMLILASIAGALLGGVSQLAEIRRAAAQAPGADDPPATAHKQGDNPAPGGPT